MIGISLLALLGVLLGIRFILGGDKDDWICEKGIWIRHGNPSAPMPASGCGEESETASEDICTSEAGNKMTYEQARRNAEEKCLEGTLTDNYFCNPNSGTWWIDFVPDEPKEGCNPACVVFVDSGQTEINWRCSGLVSPDR